MPVLSIVKEGRRLATLCVWGIDYPQEEANEKPCQGWKNAATWCFNLYFTQEKTLCEALARLIRENGTISPDDAAKLFDHAQRTQLMEQIDADCTGVVFVPEILDHVLADRK